MKSPPQTKPLVSCVVPFLNGEEFIGEAIESVLSQTYQRRELILVDDGTTDGAAAIARSYCDAHPDSIRCVSHPGGRNLGTGATRNAGVRIARGEYVAFLDADDIWSPYRLEAHMEIFARHPEAAMVVGPTLFWTSWNPDAAPWWRPWACNDQRWATGLEEDAVLAAPSVATHFLEAHGRGMPPPCSVTIRRDAIDAVGGCEEAFFRSLYEDQVLYFKIFLEHPVVATGRLLDCYRQHPDSAVALAGGETGDRAARPGFLGWLRLWIEARGVSDPRLHEAIAAEIDRAARPEIAAEIDRAAGHEIVSERGPLRRLIERWQVESRMAAIWMLTPRRYNRLRRRFGLEPCADQLEAP